jgi:two-component system LytT family response regulator
MISVYILDDEQLAIDALSAMLVKKFNEKVVIKGASTDVQKALDEIDELKIDLLFIDVEMPYMNGIEVLRHFPKREFDVIFTTAHEQYALMAIKLEAIDYLLKPISPSDMSIALDRIIYKRQKINDSDVKLTLSVSGEIHVIEVKDIVRVEADNNYSIFHLINKRKIIISKTLKEYDSILSPNGFFRCHQSHLINAKFIEGLQSKEGDSIILKNGDRVELSKRKKAEFMNWIGKR